MSSIMDTDPLVTASLQTVDQQEAVDPIAALDQQLVLPTASTVAEAAGTKEDTLILRQSFQVGDLNLLCSRDAAREVIKPPTVSRIPYTVPWFVGMANIRGGLTPIVDTALVLGVERSTATVPYVLVFAHGDGSMGLLIDGLSGNQTLQTTARLPDLPPLPELLQDCVIAAYDHAGKVWLEINVQRFFEILGRLISV